ncbi:MAG: ABC transporter ATP-binding protein [Gammaproteobacteria bacterium]|nr:ABC transporter ATP-binding protein [Gammaproteobacteria bacterium]
MSSRLVVDLETVDEFVGLSVSRFIVAVLQLVGVALVLVWVHWPLALLVLLLNPAAIYCTVLMGKKVAGLKRRENSAFEAFRQSVSETLDAIHQVRAANREQHYFGRLVASAGHIRAHSAEFSWRSDASARLSFFIFVFGLDVFRALAMLMVVFSDLSIGQMFAVFGYLWYMLSPVQEVLNMQYKFSAADAALDRVNGLLRLEQEPEYAHRSNPFESSVSNAIELRDVCFRYRSGPTVLDGVSLSIGRGEKVAIVGESGGGKSTLVQVLLGLYAPTSGEILFDGVPLSEIGLDVVRRHVGVVLQSPVLFNASVRDNLLMGRSADEAALWNVLASAELADMVQQMPGGLDTVVGRSGIRLSGGQRQRLAIARMLLAEPKVVILDEATSALDTDTEARVHAGLAERLAGKTILVIAHRISAVRMADRIYVMERGRVVQEGRHEGLISEPGVYRKLYGASALAAEKKNPRDARVVSHVELGTTEG